MKFKLSLVYFFVLALNIMAGELHYAILAWCTKPMLMLILMYFYYKNTIKFDIKMLFALLFSLLGDVLLMIPNYDLFVLGLLSFLIAHIFYILMFSKGIKFKILHILPFLLFACFYLPYILRFVTSDLKIPVIVYCSVITLMGVFASLRNKSNSNYSIILFGAIFFVLSDSLLAYNKFVQALPLSSFLVMATYGMAQYLICLGWMEEKVN